MINLFLLQFNGFQSKNLIIMFYNSSQTETEWWLRNGFDITQGWPTSQMLRATFYCVFQQRATPYTRDITIALTSPHLLIHILLPCSGVGKLFVRRAVFKKVLQAWAHTLFAKKEVYSVWNTLIFILNTMFVFHTQQVRLMRF